MRSIIQTYLSLALIMGVLGYVAARVASESFVNPSTIEKCVLHGPKAPKLNNAALLAVSESFKGAK